MSKVYETFFTGLFGPKILGPRSLGWVRYDIMCQHILVSHFTCTPHGDLVWLLSPPIIALVASSVTRFGDLLYFGQLFKAFGNN